MADCSGVFERLWPKLATNTVGLDIGFQQQKNENVENGRQNNQ
jgi:hypothetical protein